MTEYFWITWNSHPLEMLTWEYTFLDICFIILQLYTKISILEVRGRAFPPTEENLYFPWHCPGNTGLNKKLTLKAEFSSLGINTVILFPATLSLPLDEEKNVLKCRDVEHILMTNIEATKGLQIKEFEIIELEIHFALILSSLFSFCAFLSSLFPWC